MADAARERGRAAGLGTDDLQAFVEGESLRAAVGAKEQGLPPVEAAPPVDVMGGNDLSTEVSYLEKVARYFAGSSRQQLLTPDGHARRHERSRTRVGGQP